MKKLAVVGAMLIVIGTFSGSAFAWSPSIQGQPAGYRGGEQHQGYYIWRDDEGLHLRTTTRGVQHEFSGVIRTDGEFVQVRGARLERDDFYRVSRDGNHIRFKFETDGGRDGLDFRLHEGTYANFELYLDGQRIDPREISIGDRGYHPRHASFTLWR